MVKFPFNIHLRTKLLILFALVSLVPLIILSGINIYQGFQSSISSKYAENLQLSTALANEIESMVASRADVLRTTSQLPQIQSMDAPQQVPILKVVKQQYADFASVTVVDTAGNQVARDAGRLPNVADRSYFKAVMQGAKLAVSEILITKATGRPSIIVCLPVDNSQGTLAGAILATVDITEIGNKAKTVKAGQTGFAFITDRTGKIIAHPEQELVDKQADMQDLAPVAKAVARETGMVAYDWEGRRAIAGYSFVPSTGWGVVVQLPEAEAFASTKKQIAVSAGMVAVVVVLVVAAALLISRAVTKPLDQLVKGAELVASGDLTKSLPLANRDEIGQVSEAFNAMAAQLRKLIRHIMANAEQIAASCEELSASAGQSTQAANQIAASIATVSKGVGEQLAAVNDSSAVAGEITVNVQQLSASANTVAGTSVEAVERAKSGSKSVDKAIEQMKKIEDTVTASAGVVAKLGERSKEIGQIIDTISGIAGQTNLLALNAAIEAARAGEQGRGFAVVAEEVRKLAEQSQSAAKQIADMIGEIQQDTDRAVAAMSDGTRETKLGAEVIDSTGQVFMEIATLVTQVAEQIKEISAAMQQINGASRQIVGSIATVSQLNEKSADEAQTVSAATEEQLASMEEIASSSQALARLAQELQNAVNEFRI